MDIHPKKQHGDVSPLAHPHGPPGNASQPQAQHPEGPPEPPETRVQSLPEANRRQHWQDGIQGRAGHRRDPRNFFISSSDGIAAGPPQVGETPNNFQKRNRMKGHFTFSDVRRQQRSQQPKHPQASQGPSCQSVALPFATEGCKEAKIGTERMPQAGRQQQIQLGQERSETQSNKGQRQWRSRGGRSQQQLQYMWRPVAREKEDQQVQQHDQQQHQPHQRGQQQEEQHQKQQESQQQRRTQQQDGHGKCTQLPQGQQIKLQRQPQQQPLQGQLQNTPNEQQQQCKEQHQQKQQEKQQQHQPRQRQKPVPSRPACVRPQLAGGVSTVVVELHRLQRQFSSSFSLLSCHPLLLPLLQQQPYSASKDGSFPREAGSHPPGTPHPAAAARPAANHSSSTDYATPGALASAALTVDCSKETQGNCHLSCGHGAPTGGGEAGSGVPEAASSILCRFELLLVPTDPDFDANMLPGGLRLCVTMGREYPGAEAVLKDSAGVKEDFSDVAHHAVAAVTAANASSLSEGSTGSPEPGRAAEDGHPSGPSGQRAAVAGTATIASSSAEGCGRTASHSSFGVRQEGGAAVKGLSRGSSSDVAVLEVCNKDINDLRRDAIELVFSKVIEQQLARHERTDLVRTAIKALDRHMRGIFELELTGSNANSQRIELPWTEEEQRRLEEAVVLYRRVAEPTLRWRNISSHVGSRTAKECAIRFQLCRENVLSQLQQATAEEATINKVDKVEEPRDSTNEAVLDSKRQDGEVQLQTQEAASQALRGSDVSLIDSTVEGASSLHLSCIQLQVTCGRCRAIVDLRVSLPKDGASLEPAGCTVGCAKCQLRMGIRVQPVIGVGGSQLMRVAVVQPMDCYLKDLLPCDFVLACDCCGASMKAREVQSGAPRTNHCRHCHSKITFGFQGAALGLTVVCGLGTSDSRSRPSCSNQQRQRKQDLRIVVGSPLADFGTCKHYKKSYRWLRFPCCGKAYPCDVCHDSAEDHEHEWATRMICGFCSAEQPFANGKPCTCGKALTKDGGTAHWEGGKGCRDRTRMSRKDSRKYKSVNKQHAS